MDQIKDGRRHNFFIEYNDIFEIGLSKHALLVRFYLLRCMNGNHQAFPTIGTIAEKCGLGKTAAKQGLAELEEKGMLTREPRFKDDSKEKTSTLYTIINIGEGRSQYDQGVGRDTANVGRNTAIKKTNLTRPSNNKEEQTNLLPDMTPDMTDKERVAIETLQSVIGYRFDLKTDVAYVKKLVEKYPAIDVFKVIDDWAINKIETPLEKKSNARSQLNTWCSIRAERQPKQAPSQSSQSAPTTNAADETRAFINSLRGEQDAPKRDGGEGDNWLDLEGLLSDQGN